MSGRDGGWLLPDVIDPDRICITINVPNEPRHLQAFWGALWELCYWFNWQRDLDHRGAAVADVWKSVWYEANDAYNAGLRCEMFEVRQNTGSPCELDYSEDGGATWTPFANLRLCAPHIVMVGGVPTVVLPDGSFVDPGSSGDYDGRTAPYTPPTRGGTVDEAICLAAANAENVLYNMHSQIFSRVFVPDATWAALVLVSVIVGLLALAVAVAVIVSVIVAGGGVAILSGVTLANYSELVRKQMRCILIARATNTAGVVTFDYAAVKSDVEAKISGINIWAALDLYLQVIGESGLNRAGATTAITYYDCEDCAEWCYHFDFTVDDGGFSVYVSGANTYGSWVSGVGWRSSYFPSPAYNNVQDVIIGRSFTETNLHSIVWDVTYLNNSAPQAYLYSDFPPTEFVGATRTWTGNEDWTGIALNANEELCTSTQYVIITGLTIRGTGDCPFGDPNC